MVHDKIKDQKCELCSKCFSRSSDLRCHILTVHEKKRIQCPLCPKTKGSKSNLRKHIRTIHEKQTHKCNSCDRIFNSREGLKYHYSVSHNGLIKMIECKMCGKTLEKMLSSCMLKKFMEMKEKVNVIFVGKYLLILAI